MLRATPELAKVTVTRTGPPRSPQPLAARATWLSASTSAERLGRPLLDGALERVELRLATACEVVVVAPRAPTSGRSAMDTVGMPEPARLLAVMVAGTLAGSHAGAAAAMVAGGEGGTHAAVAGGFKLA